jgi:glyoxylase I family protein
MNFSHIALNCSDIAATIDYYTRHFGFKVSRRLPIGGDLEIVFIARDDVHLELFPVEGRSIPKEVDGPSGLGTLRHIAFQVDDVDALIEKMGSDAVLTLGPLGFDVFIPGWRTAWLRDPNGHIVEVSQGYKDDLVAS